MNREALALRSQGGYNPLSRLNAQLWEPTRVYRAHEDSIVSGSRPSGNPLGCGPRWPTLPLAESHSNYASEFRMSRINASVCESSRERTTRENLTCPVFGTSSRFVCRT